MPRFSDDSSECRGEKPTVATRPGDLGLIPSPALKSTTSRTGGKPNVIARGPEPCSPISRARSRIAPVALLQSREKPGESRPAGCRFPDRVWSGRHRLETRPLLDSNGRCTVRHNTHLSVIRIALVKCNVNRQAENEFTPGHASPSESRPAQGLRPVQAVMAFCAGMILLATLGSISARADGLDSWNWHPRANSITIEARSVTILEHREAGRSSECAARSRAGGTTSHRIATRSPPADSTVCRLGCGWTDAVPALRCRS